MELYAPDPPGYRMLSYGKDVMREVFRALKVLCRKLIPTWAHLKSYNRATLWDLIGGVVRR